MSVGVPRQLPVVSAAFVNRDAVRAAIGEEVRRAHADGRPAFVALYGAGGVGVKSAVWKWYWEDSGRFPDGALAVELGDAEHGDPAALSEALGSALVALGVPPGELPVSVADRHKCLLTKTFGRRLLVALVDVVNPAQVKPFLLNSPGSVVVAVCRTPLRELVRLGFRQVPVAPLDTAFGMELFERVLGPGWCSVDGADPVAVVRACGGYPLAITTTAAQIAMTSEWDVPGLLRRLAERGMSALDEDAQEYVRESFDRTYVGLSVGVARTYRLVLGVHPGREFGAAAAAALLGTPDDQVQANLMVLVKAQLVTRIAADRYTIHDLVRWHARDCLVRDEPVEVIRSAARSVIEWYLDATVRFDKALSSRPRVGPRYEVVDAHAGATGDATRTEALSWLEHQRTNLVEAVLLAERHELDDLAWQLCEALWGVFHLHGHYEDWIITHRAGLACAAHSGDRRAEMRMSSQLGAVLLATGDLAEAEISFAASLAAAREVADSLGEQSALEWLGKVAAKRGDLEPALSYLDHSQRVAESAVDTDALPRIIAILALQRGRFLALSGQFPQTLEEFIRAADYFDITTETDNKAKVALETGRVLGAMDRAEDAVPLLQRARAGFFADGSLRGEAATLEVLISVGADTAENTSRLSEIYTILGDARVRELPR